MNRTPLKSLRVRAFPGVRFDPKKVSTRRGLCPPYDVIPEDLARRLRRIPSNTIHIELPGGPAGSRYARARKTWLGWLRRGVVRVDEKPAFYVVEESFRHGGRLRKRCGFLCALGLDSGSARRILPHERTLPKPKKDRARLLRTLKVNASPVFCVYSGRTGTIRRLAREARRGRPLISGGGALKVSYKLWKLDDVPKVSSLERAFGGCRLLIADGHHRYEVCREHRRKTGGRGAGAMLVYLVDESDPGLTVEPTHRVLRPSRETLARIDRLCVSRRVSGPEALMKALTRARSPYAFGLWHAGGCRLMTPRPKSGGVPSRFGTDWLTRRILKGVDAQDIAYVHGAAAAVSRARRIRGAAFLIKPFPVPEVRKAAARAGLLPQKSTYFYPKISAGLVFREL